MGLLKEEGMYEAEEESTSLALVPLEDQEVKA